MSKTILVVEDDKALQDAIVSKLRTDKIDSRTASSYDEAVKILKSSQDLDAVWLDHYLMGENDGLGVIKKMRELNDHKDTPVYVVSNTISPEKVKYYFEYNAKKFYVKSDYRLEEIISEIKQGWK